MDFFQRTIRISSWLGVAVVKPVKTQKGVEYVTSRKAMVPFLLQILVLPWMVWQFRRYMSLKGYYSPNRRFQVTVLMYCEVAHCLFTVMCSCFFRFPNIKKFLWSCTCVMRDLQGSKIPALARYTTSVSLTLHLLLTLYRTKDSTRRPALLLPFWIGMNQVVMVVVLLQISLTLVDMTLHDVNRDLTYVLRLRSRESSQFIKRQLILLRQRHYRGLRLLVAIRKDFGPDVFVLCFLFLFKLTFICYHMYYKKDMRLWGQNPLVGELTGYFQILQLVICSMKAAYVSDTISEKMAKVEVTLLYLLKDRIEGNDSEIKNLIKCFLVQNQSCPRGFSVCNHFTFNRELIYNMILGAVTYVFILIQFQGNTKPQYY